MVRMNARRLPSPPAAPPRLAALKSKLHGLV